MCIRDSARVDRAAGKHPEAAHEALLRVAPDEQQLNVAVAVADEDQRGRLARRRRLALAPKPLADRRSLHAAKVSPTLRYMTTETAITRWVCESCGFIYDPEEGDPDGGIPPGTAFEEIPDTWFCPVCGARKKDFTRFED